MREIKIKDEYIKLEQLLKLSGEVLSGGMAKEDIRRTCKSQWRDRIKKRKKNKRRRYS